MLLVIEDIEDCKTMTKDIGPISEGEEFFYLCHRAGDIDKWYYSFLSFILPEPDTVQGSWVGPFASEEEAISKGRIARR